MSKIGSWGLSWPVLDLFWPVLTCLEPVLGLSWPVLGLSWPVLACLGPVLGLSWGCLGHVLACLCLSCTCLGSFWVHLVLFLACLGPILVHFWTSCYNYCTKPCWHSLSAFCFHLAARRYVRSTSAASRRDAQRAKYKVQVPNIA